MTMQDYSTINDSTTEEGMLTMIPEGTNPSTMESSPLHFLEKSKVRLFIAAAIGLCVVGCSLLFSTLSSDASNVSASIHEAVLSSSSSKKESGNKCTFDECNAASCNVETAPYTCVLHNGGPHGGCLSHPWDNDTCDYQCDLSDCDTAPIPEDADTCNDVPCETTWCASTNAVRCPNDLPYQCLEGSARFGCTADPNMWGFKSPSTTCSKCCDVGMCKE